jgi:putative phosphoribosyl transferase
MQGSLEARTVAIRNEDFLKKFFGARQALPPGPAQGFMQAEIIEKPQWHNKEQVYADRQEAGRVLAELLAPYCGKDAIVLAIPAGGVAVGAEIARNLGLDLDLLIIRKMPIPGETESGFGAISLQGDMVLDRQLVRLLGLDEETIQELKKPVERELRERDRLFRQGRPFPALEKKTVVLVDDGLAAGYTMSVAAAVARRKKSAKIIIAVPTAPLSTIGRLMDMAEVIVCPNIREGPRFAVAAAYRRWYDLDHDEVIRLLRTTALASAPGTS